MLIRIIRAREKLPRIDWNFKTVKSEQIRFYSEEENVLWTWKISFGRQRIYLGYKPLGDCWVGNKKDTAVVPCACLAQTRDGKRVGVSLWGGKPSWNLLSETEKTLEEITEGIVADLNLKVNPVLDVRLEKKFKENRM